MIMINEGRGRTGFNLSTNRGEVETKSKLSQIQLQLITINHKSDHADDDDHTLA